MAFFSIRREKENHYYAFEPINLDIDDQFRVLEELKISKGIDILPSSGEEVKREKDYSKEKKHQVSDDEFFKLIRNPDNLALPKSIQRIKMWQMDLIQTDKNVVYEAQEKLKKIGTELAFVGWDKTRKTVNTAVIVRFWNINYKWIKENKINRIKTQKEKREYLKNCGFGKFIEEVEFLESAPSDLATQITCNQYELSFSYVRKLRKKCKIYKHGEITIYYIKTPL